MNRIKDIEKNSEILILISGFIIKRKEKNCKYLKNYFIIFIAFPFIKASVIFL